MEEAKKKASVTPKQAEKKREIKTVQIRKE